MTGRTWVIMVIVLGLNWGGFIAMLIYGIRREAQKRRAGAPDDGTITS